jgi:transposase
MVGSQPSIPLKTTRSDAVCEIKLWLLHFNGILWVLRSGARWKDLPPRYGSRSTCHRRLQEWQEQGVWERIWLTFLGELDQQGKLDWSQAFLDGSFVSAKKGERILPMAIRARVARSIC